MDKRTPPRYQEFRFEGGRLFYRKTMGGENVGRLFVREGWDGREQLLFDPNLYKKGTNTAIKLFVPSPDGKYVVLGLAAEGGEWSELRVLQVDDGQLFPDSIYPVAWYGISWLPGSQAFLYNGGDVTDVKSPDVELNRKIRTHKLGSPTSDDRDILSVPQRPNSIIAPEEIPVGDVPRSRSDRLIGGLYTVQRELRLYMASVSELGGRRVTWKPLVKRSDNLRDLVLHGDSAYAVTHTSAPRYRVVRARADAPDWKSAETVVPEAVDSIDSIDQSKDYLLVTYSDGIKGRLVRYEFSSGGSQEITLPIQGTVNTSCPDIHGNRCIVTISSWLQPPALYELNAETAEMTKSAFSGEAKYPELTDLVSEEVVVPGHDGTMVPLSIIHRKDIKLDGSSPCILEGYGARAQLDMGFNPGIRVANRGSSSRSRVRGRRRKRRGLSGRLQTTKPNVEGHISAPNI